MLSWKDIFSQNWSRKAGVAVVTIAAIYMIATQQIEEGKTLSIEICLHGMYLIAGVGGVARKKPGEETIAESIDKLGPLRRGVPGPSEALTEPNEDAESSRLEMEQ